MTKPKLVKARGKNVYKYDVLRHKRFILSRISAVFLILVCLFTKTEIRSDIMRIILDGAGLLLIVAGSFGRIWSSMYISGYKKKELITQGPYAAVQNPLYMFSFFGLTGIALCTNNFIFLLLTVLLFPVYYYFVITAEELKLQLLHKDHYKDYTRKTPRFIPKFSELRQPEKYEVNIKKSSRVFKDVIWFFIVYILIDLIKYFHSKDLIPIFLEV